VSAGSELRTERLLLRPWRQGDLDALAEINRDPAVTEFLGGPADRATTAAFLAKTREHWERHGFGHYAVELRAGPRRGELIGFAGVAYPVFLPPLADRPELGWRLARSAWGAGLATEAAIATRDEAFSRHNLAELISIIDPDNSRSRRVAEKVGMSIERTLPGALQGRDVEVWRLGAPGL
jgi:RimJ/RimL family protein N-acetyltransferase